MADPTTVRRWFWRRIESLRFFAALPTLLSGLARRQPYSADRANLTMMDLDRDAPQPRISLLDYLQQHGWKTDRDRGGDEVAGLCPLHQEHHPSLYVNRRKHVFYCHCCGCGGGLARLIYLLHDYPHPRSDFATAELLLEHTYRFPSRRSGSR